MKKEDKIENMKKLEGILNNSDLIYERLRKDKKVTYKTLHKMILDCPIFKKDLEELEYTKEQIEDIEKDEKEILILCMKLADKLLDYEAERTGDLLKEIFETKKDSIAESEKDEKIQKIVTDLLDTIFDKK